RREAAAQLSASLADSPSRSIHRSGRMMTQTPDRTGARLFQRSLQGEGRSFSELRDGPKRAGSGSKSRFKQAQKVLETGRPGVANRERLEFTGLPRESRALSRGYGASCNHVPSRLQALDSTNEKVLA